MEEGRNYEITWELDPPHLCEQEEPENTLVEEVHYQTELLGEYPELPTLPPH